MRREMFRRESGGFEAVSNLVEERCGEVVEKLYS